MQCSPSASIITCLDSGSPTRQYQYNTYAAGYVKRRSRPLDSRPVSLGTVGQSECVVFRGRVRGRDLPGPARR